MMIGLDIVGADKHAKAGIVATTSRPWWKTALYFTGGFAVGLLLWRVAHQKRHKHRGR
jgi:H+/Cl- antiporter ClcA